MTMTCLRLAQLHLNNWMDVFMKKIVNNTHRACIRLFGIQIVIRFRIRIWLWFQIWFWVNWRCCSWLPKNWYNRRIMKVILEYSGQAMNNECYNTKSPIWKLLKLKKVRTISAELDIATLFCENYISHYPRTHAPRLISGLYEI